MPTTLKPATTPPMREGEAKHEQITPRAGKPKTSGYAETKPSEATAVNEPNPDAPGAVALNLAFPPLKSGGLIEASGSSRVRRARGRFLR